MLLLHLPTRGNNVNKSSSCFKSANWKNMTHPVCGSIKQAHKPGPFLHFFHHFLFKFIKILKYAPLQEGTNWAFKAVSQVWPGTDIGDSPWGCCRVCGVRGFQAVRVTNKKAMVAWLAVLPPGAHWEIMPCWLSSCSPAIMTGGTEAMTRWHLDLIK